MVYFVGAGPGAPDLITVRGQRLLERTGAIVYAGSLVNPALLDFAGPDCETHDSAAMTLEQVVEVLAAAERAGKDPVRLHTGDPSIYGAIREQMDMLDGYGIKYEVVPGVSSFQAAAASLKAEYTLPGVSQTVILTRLEGRTPVPVGEDIALLAAHGSSMAVFLSAGMLDRLSQKLIEGGHSPSDPAAIVYRASWDDEKIVRTTVGELEKSAAAEGISKTALILAGGFLDGEYERSRLYDPKFSHGFRKGADS